MILSLGCTGCPESGYCGVVFLYAANMCCSHLLVNKASWVYDKAEIQIEPGGNSKQRYRTRGVGLERC